MLIVANLSRENAEKIKAESQQEVFNVYFS